MMDAPFTTTNGMPTMKAPVFTEARDETKRTTDPIVTGASVIGIKYRDGVMMISDTLASYGSLARFKEIERLLPVGKSTVIGASGEYSDFQQIFKTLDQLIVNDLTHDDGIEKTPRQIFNYLGRVMYNRRSRINPYWNQVVVGGYHNNEPFIGYTDLFGSCFEENHVATGYGAHLAIPLIRDGWKADMSEGEAKQLLETCMTVLYYRDCRTINRIQLAKITAQGTEISQPYSLTTNWEFTAFIRAGGH